MPLAEITKLLEEAPGVRSISRFVALLFALMAAGIVVTACYISVYAIVHAKQHEDHASAAIGAAGQLITQLSILCAPVISAIWIALKLRKPTPDDPTITTTSVTTTGPAGAQPAVNVTPAAPGSAGGGG